MPRKASSHLAAHGTHKAASLAPDRVEEALAEFKKLNTREARAAFADYWIGVWAEDFEYAWPMLYELLQIVDEEELYRDPRRVGPGAPGGQAAHGSKASYETFADYFADRVRHPFERWAELEQAHRYAQTYAPGLLEGALSAALTAAEQAEKAQRVADAKREEAIALADEVPISPRGGDRRSLNFQNSNTVLNARDQGESYLRRRLKDDHPDLYEQVKGGTLSASAAAIEAGIRHRTASVRIDDVLSAARTLRQHFKDERRVQLAELLTKED